MRPLAPFKKLSLIKMLAQFSYCYRLFFGPIAHGLLYIYGFFSLIIYFPLLCFLIRKKPVDERQIRCQHYVHRLFRFYVYGLVFFRIIDISVENEEYLRQAQGHMIISNHPSFFDAIIMIAHAPQADCIVKESVFKNIFLGSVMRAAGYIKNTYDAEDLLNECVKRLKNNRNIIVFPEGTRTSLGKKIIFKRGFINVVLRADAIVQKVYINVFPFTMRKESRWYEAPYKKPHFTFIVKQGKRLVSLDIQQPLSLQVRHKVKEIEKEFQDRYMQDIKLDLKNLIVETLNLEDITAEDIDDDMLLFSDEGLGLDSIDALELGVMLQKRYNIKKLANKGDEDVKKAFQSVNSLADFITSYNMDEQ